VHQPIEVFFVFGFETLNIVVKNGVYKVEKIPFNLTAYLMLLARNTKFQ